MNIFLKIIMLLIVTLGSVHAEVTHRISGTINVTKVAEDDAVTIRCVLMEKKGGSRFRYFEKKVNVVLNPKGMSTWELNWKDKDEKYERYSCKAYCDGCSGDTQYASIGSF